MWTSQGITDNLGNPIMVLVPDHKNGFDLASAAESEAFTSEKIVRIVAITADTRIFIGPNNDTTNDTGIFMAQGSAEYFAVYTGYKIATVGSDINVTPCK